MHFPQTFDLLKTFRRLKSPSDCRFRRLDRQATAFAAPEIMEVDQFGGNPEPVGRSVKAATAQYVVFLNATMIWALQLLSTICGRWMRNASVGDERFNFAAMSRNDFRRKECHGH